MEEFDDILKQVGKIRDYVNESRKHYGLFQNRTMFFQMSSSMDVIEDTELAIRAFLESVFSDDNHKGNLYLATYGLLQAIYVQQDATENLSEALNIPVKINAYQRLNEIRSIRNDSIGHPTKRNFRKKSNNASYHFITRISLSKNGFNLLSHSSDGEFKSKHINTVELIEDQRKYISEILENMKKKLRQEENEHREKFRHEKLTDIFHSSTGYNFEKIYEGIYTNDPVMNEGYCAIALGCLEAVTGYISSFLDAVKNRDISRYEYLLEENVEIEFASQWLHDFLKKKMKMEILAKESELTASIFVYFLDKKVKSLIIYAKEIDEEYASNV